MKRREFLNTSLAAASLATFPAVVRGAASSGRRFRTALIGCGWWGNVILREAMATGTVEVVGLCDVDRRQFEPTLKAVREGTGDTPPQFKDYRELLERTKPEIVIVGTPDHWHALPTIAALKAGAHVYVEKPIGHTIGEGQAMVKAARESGKVVQVGTHRRVSHHNLTARDFIRGGGVGEIGMIRCFVNSGGGRDRVLPTQPVPAELDWDLWCGPAPVRPYNGGDPRDPQRAWAGAIHPRGFRNYLDYANGTLGDWGIHWLDQVLWIMEEKHPRHVFSTAGRPVAGEPILTETEQTADAPDHQLATYRFDRFSVQWEHRRFGGNPAEKAESVGCYFYGTKGVFHLGWRQGWTFFPANPKEDIMQEEPQLNEPDSQNVRELWDDFIRAIRTGTKPACDLADIHLATNLSLLGMLSWRHGRSIEWDGTRERVVGDEAANALLRREYRKGWEYPS